MIQSIKARTLLIIGIWLSGLTSPTLVCAYVTVDRSEKGFVVKVDDKPFTEFLPKAGHSPALYPLIGPTGKAMTRAYPFAPATNDGTHDHPHHQSLWFTLDKLNGVDFWAANANDSKGDGGPHVALVKYVAVESGGPTSTIITRNDWMNGKDRICEDKRTMMFGTGPADSRWIDFSVVLKASNGDVTLGDTKEGAFAIRVADSMRVDAKKGGRIVNSEGLENAAAWGMPARWVDYTGPVDGEIVGITMMSHPDSFRPVPRWHVRTYGLFAANPIGQKDFPHPEAAQQGPITIKNGDSLKLHYRVLLHRGKTDAAEIEKAFDEFVRTKPRPASARPGGGPF